MHIVRTLFRKEVSRLASQRSAMVLAALLIASAVLLRTFGQEQFEPQRIHTCWIDYWTDGPWIEHLRSHVPSQLRDQIRFRHVGDIPTDRHGTLQYGRGEVAIQIRDLPPSDGQQRWKIWFWYSGRDAGRLRPFEEWFWRESASFSTSSNIETERSSLHGFDVRTVATAALALFAIFFVCVCVMPAITCEEKERGVFAAQALSPANTSDAIIAKAVLYVPLAALLGILLAFIASEERIPTPFFAGAIVSATAAFGVGLAIAALAPTQRSAGSSAVCCALATTITTALLQRSGIPFINDLLVESHLAAAFGMTPGGALTELSWRAPAIAAILAGSCMATGSLLFSRCWRNAGWSG